MTRNRTKEIFLLGLLLLPFLGCVERRFFIRSEPPGATVFIDSVEAGKTPLQHPFVHYGGREVELTKPGYQRVKVQEAISPPWYEIFPLDFFFDVVLPFTIVDKHELFYRMEKTPPQDSQEGFSKELIERAKELKSEVE